MNPRLTAFSVAFASVFGFSLYFLACTASIYSNYQPDISRVHWFNPCLVLLVSFVIASRLAQRRLEIVRFLQLALALCAIIFVIILGGHSECSVASPIPPAERTLKSTVCYALAKPSFSNRSFASPIDSALVAAILWWVIRARKNRNAERLP